MSFLFKSTDDVKTPGGVPKTLTKAEIAVIAKELTYALPSMVTLTKPAAYRGKGRKGKGKLTVYKFPTPAEADRMNKPLNIIQTQKLTRINNSTTVEIDGGINFTFSQINQYNELAAVFDQYRFVLIEIKFLPTIQALATGNQGGMFFTCVDTDDSSSTTASAIRDYPGCVSTESFKGHTHIFQPHVAIAAYSGAFTSFSNAVSPWIDVASPSVQHYGVKYAYDLSPAIFYHDIIVRIHVQLRNVR